MIVTETALPGVYTLEIEPHADERGFFARTWDGELLAAAGLDARASQQSVAFNHRAGTLRGLHFQRPPHAETKLVRCIRGGLHDIILDLRNGSPTFGRSFGADLTAENRRMMYVPKGFAHGFITIEPNTEAFYFVDEFYAPEQERGVRWNDPKFKIAWPLDAAVLSDKDKNQRDFDPAWHLPG